jgi:hypothetical protein
MPEAAHSEEIHLGNGPRHLWNVRPKTTQKGLHFYEAINSQKL